MIKNTLRHLHKSQPLHEPGAMHGSLHLEDLYRDAFPQIARLLHGLGADLPTARDLFHDAIIIYLEKNNDRRLPENTSATQYLAGISKILWFKKFWWTIRKRLFKLVQISAC